MRARYGRRIRRGVAGTAVAAAAMAALTGSQAPGLLQGVLNTGVGAPIVPPPGDPIDGGSSDYFTELPPLNTPIPSGSATPGTGTGTVTTDGTGLPASVLEAYRRAETALAASDPGCNMRWELLAAIGQVESNQARGGNVDSAGTTLSPILGPVLNGDGFANITDTDGGKWDGDTVHDRAIGPMQFIPSTWQTWGADGNDDGVSDPNNIFDAALAAGRYLCAGNRDLSIESNLHQAILGYNHSTAYLNTVLSWYEHFRKGGVVSVPDIGDAGSDLPDSPPSSTTPSTSPSPTWSPTMSASPTKKPTPTASASGTIGTPSGHPSPTDSPTTGPSTDPTHPTTDPTEPSGPTDPPTCPTDSGSPTATPTDTTSPSQTGTPDPCATASPGDSPSPTETEGGTATGPVN
ncbi:lytic transglycosylase domain-containing protein [Actinacidiphila glaucinigra]|uniref:Transglycosylase SLT domain-containing protein n=1 Tax=Actinacidiphila glaucinigra TaxID=235986 RepID=A0A238ZWM1_9ACTN|nr:lytic transglycosylase domain-containing protein [Actinacidiphila glaucinigra]SNR87391.1 Transglycosylase SLT domain-containing protein [Actinacidiphila glaucinigra]